MNKLTIGLGVALFAVSMIAWDKIEILTLEVGSLKVQLTTAKNQAKAQEVLYLQAEKARQESMVVIQALQEELSSVKVALNDAKHGTTIIGN